ncbi:YbdD/YjiX family protein [Pseudonocardia spirodelae]|uniref:YbdD/YjiX family protein n=1 Tax=Pseudonocardia spirodelae TaxID=3133431 RepID=A0ABU8TCU9_9PSEU
MSRLRAAWDLVRELAGERDYERYLAHRARYHPGEPVLGEREFWRERTDRQERVASARCC